MKSAAKNIQLASYDDLFKTDEERLSDTQERVQSLPLDRLTPFPNHPFKVLDDEKMLETVESIKERGVLVPILVRPTNDGNFEIVSGHRRHHASQLAGLTEIPAIVREMDDDNLIRAYEKTARTDYYRTIGAEPMSVVILKRPFGEVPKGVKLLWVCGDRCFHTPVGVFNGNLKSPAKLCFIPVEQVLDPDDYRLKGIDLNSRAPSENAYMKRYNVEDYIVRTRAERER